MKVIVKTKCKHCNERAEYYQIDINDGYLQFNEDGKVLCANCDRTAYITLDNREKVKLDNGWFKIPNFPYEINKAGKVRNIKISRKIIKIFKGYVYLFKNGTPYRFNILNLVRKVCK